MRARRVEEADALAVRIGKDIARRSKTRLSQTDSQTGTKDMWAAYRQLTGRKQKTSGMHGITAESLNQHYRVHSTRPTRCSITSRRVLTSCFAITRRRLSFLPATSTS